MGGERKRNRMGRRRREERKGWRARRGEREKIKEQVWRGRKRREEKRDGDEPTACMFT